VTIARSARQPRPACTDARHPYKLNAVFWANRKQARSGERYRNAKNGLPQDRRLCANGFIIRAQAMIRADGRRPRQIGEGLRARASSKFFGYTPAEKFERGF
jgi:hypothetical protein